MGGMHIYKSRRQGHKTKKHSNQTYFLSYFKRSDSLILSLGDKITPPKKKCEHTFLISSIYNINQYKIKSN